MVPNQTAVNFINILHTNFSYKYDGLAAFPKYMYVDKAAIMMFVQKTRAYNVDEIDTRVPPFSKDRLIVVTRQYTGLRDKVFFYMKQV